MGKAKKTKKFAMTKRLMSPNDARAITSKEIEKTKKEKNKAEHVHRNIPQLPSSFFFNFNSALGPPFHVLVDTNFINFSIKQKIELKRGMMDCLYAKCTPYITDCVMAELEKLGPKFKVALKIAKDKIFQRLPCSHAGTYADDCLCQRVTQHRCYVVATNDKDLRRRIRKIPGVPIMYVGNHRYKVEQMPDNVGAHSGLGSSLSKSNMK